MPLSAHPILVTPDVARLHAFYGGLLGAEVTGRVPDDGPVFHLQLRAGAVVLGLVADDAVAVGEPGRILLSIDVDDIDVILPRVAELGGEVTGGPIDMPWGQRVAHVSDPDGNALNLDAPVAGD